MQNTAIKHLIRLLSVVFLAAFILLALKSAAILVPPVQNALRQAAENALSQRLTGRLSIGSLRLGLLGAIELYDIVITDPAGLQDSLTIRSIRIRYELLPLLKRKVVLRSIAIRDIRASGVRTMRGEIHLPFLVRPTSRPPPFTLELRTITVRHLALRYTDSLSRTSCALSGVDARLFFFRLDSLAGALAGGPWRLMRRGTGEACGAHQSRRSFRRQRFACPGPPSRETHCAFPAPAASL